VGEDTVNGVLRQFPRQGVRRRRTPPRRNSSTPQARVDPKRHGLIDDLFWKITFFDNRITDATATKLADGRYRRPAPCTPARASVDDAGKETEAVPTSRSTSACLPPAKRRGRQAAVPGKRLLPKGDSTVTVVVDGKPAEAGIDPYNELIDRISSDNRRAVSLREQQARPGDGPRPASALPFGRGRQAALDYREFALRTGW
jgi:hypothetical protein